ncbi:MAG: hypothetical protein OEY41_06595, partial [Acidimicrobiia bacterium]|nr:hypothetical protein [Acidimicrobiia bacterium]
MSSHTTCPLPPPAAGAGVVLDGVARVVAVVGALGVIDCCVGGGVDRVVGGTAVGRTVAAGRGVAGVVAERAVAGSAVAGSAVAGSDGVPDGRFAGSVGGGRRTTASLLVGPAGGGDG